MTRINSVSIIGCGPAGISCAIQLKRYCIDPVIFEMDSIGGLLRSANLVENYPGFPEGINGEQLVMFFDGQLKREGIFPVFEKVLGICVKEGIFTVSTSKEEYFSKYLVLATGTIPIIPDIHWDEKNNDARIHYNISDIKGVKGEKIVVIGGGDIAYDYAVSLSELNKVTVIYRSKPKCNASLLKKTQANKNISTLKGELVKLEKNNDRLNIRYKSEQKEMNALCDHVVLAVGREPNNELLNGFENIPNNMFVIGDAKNGKYRQTGICIGDGIKCAMQISEDISGSL